MPLLPPRLVDIWDYLAGDPGSSGATQRFAGPADAIVCLGSANLGTARRAAVLFHAGAAARVVVSGGALWPAPPGATEADAFADELVARGVPPTAMVMERRATNTGENARFAVEALDATGVSPRQLVVVCFPTLTRRAAATFALTHPGIAVQAVPSFATFADFEGTPVRAVELVVAEVRRLLAYPAMGLMAPLDVPRWVVEATAGLAGTPLANASSEG